MCILHGMALKRLQRFRIFYYRMNIIYILKSDQQTLAVILGIVSVIGSVVFLFGKSIPEPERDEEQTLAQACKDYTLSAWYKLFEYEGSL